MLQRFIRYSTAARGLLLLAVTVTALLALFSPTSLTARAADIAGDFGDVLALAGLLLAACGWFDLLWHDLLGQDLLASVDLRTRHKLCVLLYAALSGWYAVFAFTATDVRLSTSWILIADYVLVAAFGVMITISLALEEREGAA